MELWMVTGAIADNERIRAMIQAGEPVMKKFDVEVEVIRRLDITYTTGITEGRKLFVNGVETTAPDKLLFYGAYDPIMEGIEDALTAMGTESLNPIEAKRIAGSKLKTSQLLTRHGIPQAKTLPIFRDTPVELIKQEIGIPVVVKPDMGFGGTGVELLHSEEELKKYLADLPEHPKDMALAQPYIESSKGRDVRVAMIGGKPYDSVMRVAGNPDEFRSNVHQGGHIEDYELTPEMIELCEKVVGITGLAMCGLDLMFGEDGFIIGEINDSPGMGEMVQRVGIEKFIKGMMGM